MIEVKNLSIGLNLDFGTGTAVSRFASLTRFRALEGDVGFQLVIDSLFQLLLVENQNLHRLDHLRRKDLLLCLLLEKAGIQTHRISFQGQG